MGKHRERRESIEILITRKWRVNTQHSVHCYLKARLSLLQRVNGITQRTATRRRRCREVLGRVLLIRSERVLSKSLRDTCMQIQRLFLHQL